jgi:prepilin-type N-terminal cleavage/methylation domain-containing protein
MRRPAFVNRGYSMIEMLMVLAIVAILAVVGVSMIGNKSAGSVRSVMDEVEGTLMAAQKLAVSAGKDAQIVTQGNWAPGDIGNPPLIITYGANQTPANILAAGLTAAESFKVALVYNGTTPVGLARDHQYAGIVPVLGVGSGWWATSLTATGGRANPDLSAISLFTAPSGSSTVATATSAFQGLLDNGNTSANLFQGGVTTNTIRVSGTNKRFDQTFFIKVVGLRGGSPIPGGPMGLLVGLANGATIYKFYNPGVLNGDGIWRRI